MRKIALLAATLLLTAATAVAQRHGMLRYNCMPQTEANADGSSPAKAPPRKLTLKDKWDATRTYPVAVVLVSYSDLGFAAGDPAIGTTLGDISDVRERYDRMFNETGFNRSRGPGCVREYFQEQSGGRFNPRFDVYGPITINATSNSYNGKNKYGANNFREAVQQLADTTTADFSVYDWDSDGRAEAIVIVYAGYGGNDSNVENNNYCWPNTNSFTAVEVGGTKVSRFSASAELWYDDRSFGIGTICHEYCHTLGLPDIYPTDGDEYSVCDEWDLMDGGNYSNNGWCPPNLSGHEKMLLGWLTPQELTGPVTIRQMKSIAEGGPVYRISTTDDDEFFLLENRQWNGWDMRSPGHGLLISHIDYDRAAWSANTVNINPAHHRYDLVHADGRDYDAWEDYWIQTYGDSVSPYVNHHTMLLSGTPYPYVTDSVCNYALTDSTMPAATTYSGTKLLSKPITDIREDEDGCISFHFMGGDTSGISELPNSEATRQEAAYDLQGRPVTAPGYRGLVIVGGRKQVVR